MNDMQRKRNRKVAKILEKSFLTGGTWISSKYSDFDTPVSIDKTAINTCESLIRNNPIIRSAMNSLINDVFSISPQFFSGGVLISPLPKMTDLMVDYMISCCKQNIESIFCKGLGMVIVKQSTDGKHEKTVRYPKCDGTIYTYYDHKHDEQGYVFIRNRQFEPKIYVDLDVQVLSGFGFDPTLKGELNSLVRPLCDEDFFMKKLHQYYIMSAHKNANPVLFTQSEKNAISEEDNKEFRYGTFADRRLIEKDESDTYEREEKEIQAVKKNVEYFNRMQGSRFMEGTSKDLSGISPQKRVEDVLSAHTIHPLPPGYTFSTQIRPETPGDFVRLKEMAKDLFASMFGNARGQFIGHDVKTVEGAKSMTDHYNNTVMHLKEIASMMLTRFYNLMFEEDDSSFFFDIYTNGTKRKTEEGAKGWTEFVESNRIKIVIPPTPNDSLNNMLVKYCIGSINKKELDVYNRISAGLNMMNSDTPSEEVTKWPEKIKMMVFKEMKNASIKNTPFALALQQSDNDLIFKKRKISQEKQQNRKREKEQGGQEKEEEEEEEQKDTKRRKSSENQMKNNNMIQRNTLLSSKENQ